MRANKPPAKGLQLDRCDVCGNKTHRGRLVRTQVEFLAPAGNNYIIQSTYDASHWTTDDDPDLGAVSVGPYADFQRLSLASDNTFTEINGAQTISTTGTIYTTVAMDDPTSWDNVCFSVEAGPYHRSETPETVFAMGVFDIDAIGTKFAQKSWTTSGQRRLWWTATPAELVTDGVTLSTLGFYITGTGSSWWADCMQLEKNATTPGQFVRTSGATVSRTAATQMTVRKVCPNCSERVLSKSERFAKTDESPVDLPVDTWVQEI